MFRTSKIVTISVFPKFLKKVDELAKEENRTRSEMFREVMRQYIAKRELENLQQYGAKRMSKIGLKETGVQRIVDQYRAKK